MKRLFLILLFVNLAYANVIFSEVMYNPAGSDGDREWIEFYNNGSSVNIEGWKLNEGGTNHGISVYQGDYLINEGEFFVIVDSPEDFLLDYLYYNGKLFDSVFSLSNTGEYLALKDNNLSLINELNYSDIAEEGYSLFNFNFSEWGQSLVEGGTPGYYETVETGGIAEDIISEVEITNIPPEIKYVHIYPDEDILDGVQIFPDINGKNVTVNALISDSNSDDLNVNVEFEKEVNLVSLDVVNSTSFNYTWNVFMEYYDEAKIYEIVLNACDDFGCFNESVVFEYKGLMFIDFSKESLSFGNVNPGSVSGINTVNIFNKGNVDVDLSLSGSDLNCDGGVIPVSSVEFFDVVGQWKNLMKDFVKYNETLPCGANNSKSLGFRFNAPVGVKTGNYTGVITIMGG